MKPSKQLAEKLLSKRRVGARGLQKPARNKSSVGPLPSAAGNIKEASEDADMETFIRTAFDANYERLRFESGHSLSPELKETALQQALLYWRRLSNIARRVTETEVHLTLPSQKTRQERPFSIEGVVDIVREDGKTIMYDLKTHDTDAVRADLASYERQLNIYAYIWRQLRSQSLDQTAVIATALPEAVRQAIESGDGETIQSALAAWDPVIEIPFATDHVEATVRDFGDVVDAIEDRKFAPLLPAKLKKRETRNETFATRVCRNCDARFSCDSWRCLKQRFEA